MCSLIDSLPHAQGSSRDTNRCFIRSFTPVRFLDRHELPWITKVCGFLTFRSLLVVILTIAFPRLCLKRVILDWCGILHRPICRSFGRLYYSIWMKTIGLWFPRCVQCTFSSKHSPFQDPRFWPCLWQPCLEDGTVRLCPWPVRLLGLVSVIFYSS